MADKGKDFGYKEKVTDEELINLVDQGVQQSVGDFLNSSELTRERLRATYEYAGLPLNHLSPQGVSEIVSTDTTETIEAYTAILSELLLSNGKIARFVPYNGSPDAFREAKVASDIVNYCIFKKNKGWDILEKWMKSALLWKNGIIRWDFVEDYDYTFEEYEEISEENLDILLAEEGIEIVGDLFLDEETLGPPMYKDVRLRRKVDNSRVKLQLIPPENFRIARDSQSIDESDFVAVQTDMTRSEIRKQWPEIAEGIEDWAELGGKQWNTDYTEEAAARKHITGQEYWQGSNEQQLVPLEANRTITITESWLRVDRDGDGIAELKRIITAGSHILHEEDVDMINVASLCPFDIPHEFFGLSMADMTRSSMLASTAILRGFVENTYLTNYSPTLADPNMVDFSALQNMKPKQIIPVNGNPAQAVQAMPPETISSGTVPLLEYLQLHKEQGTGMSKAAQGLQDELFVSGNSEIKLQQVMSAAQVRIQHIARRFAENGFKRLIKGVYMTMRANMNKVNYTTPEGLYHDFDITMLSRKMEMEIDLDIGENSNQSMVQKLQGVGQQVLPGLKEIGADMVVKPEAAAVIATKMIDALGLNPADYLEDYTTEEFKQKAAEAQQAQAAAEAKKVEEETRLLKAQADKAEADLRYVHVQADNSLQDNIRQTAVAMDKHFQEWEGLVQSAVKEGGQPPQAPDITAMFQEAIKAIQNMSQVTRQMEQKPDEEQQAPPPGGVQ